MSLIAVMSKARFSPQAALSRALIGTLGGFIAAFTFMVGLAALLFALRLLSRADAAVTAGMLAFLVWAAALLVAFGAATTQRAAAWIGGSSVAFSALGWICLRWSAA
jgi:hypothetical protein